jgi:hypothetical protein
MAADRYSNLHFLARSTTILPRRMTTPLLTCDGCGQPASSEHISKRLKRLEWTTRFRPLHIGTVLLGAVAPSDDAEFLYAESGKFAGQAKTILAAAGISPEGKSREVALAEFQRAGLLLTYVLDCPLEQSEGSVTVGAVSSARLSALAARVRRSLRPKRLLPISQALKPLLQDLDASDLGCAMVLDGGKPFAIDGDAPEAAAERLRQVLTSASAPAVR